MGEKFIISVIVPAFNEAKLIGQCIESLNDQDFKGTYEIVVVDNDCQDSTAQIARYLGAKVISCLRRGVCHARQAGADASRGEIIIQADADTIYPRWWLTRIHKQFKLHPKAVAVAGTFAYRNPPWWAFGEYFLRDFSNQLTLLFIGKPLIISGANFAFRKKALTQIGGYDQNSYSPDQFDISSRLSKVGKIIYDVKSYGRTSERSVSKPTAIIVFDFIRHLSIFALQVIKISGCILKKRGKKFISLPTGT